MEFIVTEKSGERLDKFLASRVKARSRSKWQKAIQNGAVKVNGHLVIKPGFSLRLNDRVTILEKKLLTPDKPFALEPEPEIPLDVVYEDKDIAVINKPAGLLTHPTLTHPRHTLVNVLVARYPEIVSVGENSFRPGIVHRLDKDTSGLIVIAKNQNAFLFLKKQFLSRSVEKKYLALIEGLPKEREGVIAFDIRPSKHNRLKKVAVKKPEAPKKSRRTAQTSYKVREIIGNQYALLEVKPLTGRTHQIRVHLSAIGHPVVGDRLYGSKSKILKRQFLHAYYLKFTAPNGMPLALETELPDDLKNALSAIKSAPN